MALRDRDAIDRCDCSDVSSLTSDDVEALLDFYRENYAGNWFDPRMLETKQYFGMWKDGSLVSVAGIHVYSPQYRVAALGNIATTKGHRGRGYARMVTARTCQSLLREAEIVGLNVKADNTAAISCYAGLGFEVVASYLECMLRDVCQNG